LRPIGLATSSASREVAVAGVDDEDVSPIWCRARCARFSAKKKSKPHKVRYYLERRDAEFEQKRAEVLCVFRQVQVLKKATKSKKPRKPVAIVSCDEKPEIQAIATTAPDLPPQPGVHPTFARGPPTAAGI
jgi:hypothetical protein